VQCHPTALDTPENPLALISEAVRGEGAILVNEKGERFMQKVHASAELESSGRIEIEVGAGGLKVAHARRPFFGQHRDGRRIAERGAGGQRVLSMEIRRITSAECGSDSALGVRRRAVEQRPLGQQQDVAEARCAPGGMQPGNTTADDQHPPANSFCH
jgi:hypothetical protein